MSRRNLGHVIHMAEGVLLAEVAHKGVGSDAQQFQRVKDAFALAEKFAAEAERREKAEGS